MIPAPKKSTRKSTGTAKSPTPSLVWYRRIAITFVAITFLTLAIVVYLSFSRATVHIVAEGMDVQTSFVADVVDTVTSQNETEGKVLSSVFEQAKEVMLEGEGTEQVEAKAGGRVTIYNNHSSDQPLVTTTRLLSPEGILFRIDDSVTVPSGGSVSVMAHADLKGASGNIGPTKFTIPGLAISLQEKIYAESTETMTGGVAFVRVVTEADLEQAAQSLHQEMLEAAKTTLRLEAGEAYTGEVFFDEVIERKSDTLPGAEVQAVAVSLSLRVVGVFFQKENLLELAQMKMYENLESGMDLIGFDESNVTYSVARYDVDTQIANIDVTVNSKASLAPTSDLLDLEAMIGKSPDEVKAALEASDAIQSVQISFTPFWLQRMPTLKDHIKIVIE